MSKTVPKLRFKEFYGEWNRYRLGDFTKINQGLQIAISERFTEKVEGSHFYITNEFLKKDAKKNYFIKNPPSSVLCDETDLLMTRTGNTGQVVTGVKGAFHNNFFKIKLDDGYDRWFLFYFLTSHQTQHTILKLAGTSTIPDLNHGDFYKIRINTPSLPEQQKIASFLSAVDEKIQQLTCKKELLEQYKKGVMQELFSGKLRFKDKNGKPYPKWEEKRLVDFVLSYKGGAPLTPRDFTNIPGCEVIPKKGITAGGRLIIDNETPTYCKPDFYSEYEKSVIDNSYIITTLRDLVPSGPSIGYMVQYNTKDRYILAQGVYAFKIDENKLSREWIIQFSNTTTYRKIMQTIMVGSTQVHIRNEEFFKLKLDLPSISEQQKIASFLTALDSKIESVAAQIAHTQTFKKGLLQQMFV